MIPNIIEHRSMLINNKTLTFILCIYVSKDDKIKKLKKNSSSNLL